MVVGAKNGLATTEMVVVLALVAMVVITGFSVLGDQALRATTKIASLPFGSHEPTATASAPRANLGGPRDTESVNSMRVNTVVVSRTAMYIQWAMVLLLVFGLAIQSGLTYLQARRAVTNGQSPERKVEPLDRLFEKRQFMLREMASVARQHELSQLNVAQVMSLRLTVVAGSTCVEDLADKLRTERLHHLLVSDNKEQLYGIISDRDLAQRTGRCAADVMTRSCTSVSPDTDLLAAVTTMLNRGISALPVLEDRKLVGILTTTDLALTLQCLLLLTKRDQALLGRHPE